MATSRYVLLTFFLVGLFHHFSAVHCSTYTFKNQQSNGSFDILSQLLPVVTKVAPHNRLPFFIPKLYTKGDDTNVPFPLKPLNLKTDLPQQETYQSGDGRTVTLTLDDLLTLATELGFDSCEQALFFWKFVLNGLLRLARILLYVRDGTVLKKINLHIGPLPLKDSTPTTFTTTNGVEVTLTDIFRDTATFQSDYFEANKFAITVDDNFLKFTLMDTAKNYLRDICQQHDGIDFDYSENPNDKVWGATVGGSTPKENRLGIILYEIGETIRTDPNATFSEAYRAAFFMRMVTENKLQFNWRTPTTPAAAAAGTITVKGGIL